MPRTCCRLRSAPDFSASHAQSSGAHKPKRTEEETATGNKLQLHPPMFKVSDEMGKGHRLPGASPKLGRTSSSVSTNKWKTAPATMTDEELEALLEEDLAETLSYEAMVSVLDHTSLCCCQHVDVASLLCGKRRQ